MNKNKLTYYLLGLLAPLCLLASCGKEEISPVPTQDEGRVILSYAVSGSAAVSTRVDEENGNLNRNENLVTELDLFILRGESLVTSTPLYFPLQSANDDPQDGSYEELDTGLSPNEIQNGDVIYLLANCHEVVDEITTLQDLQQATVQLTNCASKQDSFVMDGTVTVDETMRDGNNLTIQIDLRRALAKVRLHFGSKTEWTGVHYRFCHYATTATVLAQDEETEYEFVNDLELADYLSATEMAEAEPIEENGTECLVLYAYPNNWHDGDSTDDKLNVEAPINGDRETRILLYAPFGDEYYYYDVPVNFRLPTNNDNIEIPFEEYKDLYRLQRNYIYDITVNIDRPGGTVTDPGELVNLTYEVNPWEREDITVNYEDNLSYTSSGWKEEEEGHRILELLNNGQTVHFLDTEGVAELTFTINTPVVATWRAQLTGADINYFEFVDADGNPIGTTASGVASEDGENPTQQYIRIKCVEPESPERHSVTLHVYADIAGQTYEMDLTNPGNAQQPDDSNDPINRFTILQSY